LLLDLQEEVQQKPMAEESLAQIKSTIEIASADASAIQGNFRLDEAVIEGKPCYVLPYHVHCD
jgi:hypothetical protein